MPAGAEAIGVVTTEQGDTGALLLLPTGYWLGKDGALKALPNPSRGAALRGPGTKAQAAAARENGKKGGWPKGKPRKPKEGKDSVRLK